MHVYISLAEIRSNNRTRRRGGGTNQCKDHRQPTKWPARRYLPWPGRRRRSRSSVLSSVLSTPHHIGIMFAGRRQPQAQAQDEEAGEDGCWLNRAPVGRYLPWPGEVWFRGEVLFRAKGQKGLSGLGAAPRFSQSASAATPQLTAMSRPPRTQATSAQYLRRESTFSQGR